MSDRAALRRRGVVAVKGIFYTPEGDSLESPEGVLLLFEDGESVVFTSATDWTLRSERGTWPELPSWCWPPEDWEFSPLVNVPGNELLGLCRAAREIVDERGEVTGLRLQFDTLTLALRSGDTLSVEVHRVMNN